MVIFSSVLFKSYNNNLTNKCANLTFTKSYSTNGKPNPHKDNKNKWKVVFVGDQLFMYAHTKLFMKTGKKVNVKIINDILAFAYIKFTDKILNQLINSQS